MSVLATKKGNFTLVACAFVYRSETREEQLPLTAVVKIAHCFQEVINLKQIVHNLESVNKNEVYFSFKSQLNYSICIWHVLA